MNVKQNFYSSKKYKYRLLEKYLGQSNELDIKINILIEDLKNGFSLYDSGNLARFIQGYIEIPDFAEQFIILKEYYSTHNKYANSEELYKILYGETIGSLRWKEKSDKVKGENNPAYNHCGRLSPFSANFIKYEELTEIEKIRSAEEKKEELRNLKEDNPWMHGNTRKEYWIKKGYTEEESKKLISERQRTFSLEICVEKYGKKEGTAKWKQRQINWQTTLNSKPQEEIDDINRRKSSGIGRYVDRNIPGKLYYIRLYNDEIEFWKIGITSVHVFGGRFENEFVFKEKYKLNYEIIFVNDYCTILEAYELEQKILRANNSDRITVDYNKFYTTETFNRNIIKEINEIISNNN